MGLGEYHFSAKTARPVSGSDDAMKKAAVQKSRKLPRVALQRLVKLNPARPVRTVVSRIVNTQRKLQELQEQRDDLKAQNGELREVAERLEGALEKYTTLYEFAPVGYFSLDGRGVIIEANLSGANMLGVERSALLHLRLQDFVRPSHRRSFQVFLREVFKSADQRVEEILFSRMEGALFLANLQAVAVNEPSAPWCRLAMSDITAVRGVQESQRRVTALTAANQELECEISRRLAVEAALTESQRHQQQLLARAEQMQEQLRNLSRLILSAQEEERRRISRELHDEVLQTLVGINMHLEDLSHCAKVEPSRLRSKITATQALVMESVNAVHRFARELRPMILDDLGLIPALDAYISDFQKRTKIKVKFAVFPEVEKLSIVQRVVLYRVVQAALCNTFQHARATSAEVQILDQGGTVSLSVRDNGKSFDVARTLNVNRYKRLGLLGMRERVEMVGGHFEVESAPGRGTIVRARIPEVA